MEYYIVAVMSDINEKIETFVVLATVESLELADRITAAFEDMGIPVLLEHLHSEKVAGNSAFRVSTQTQFSENGMRIVDNMLSAHGTKKMLSVRESRFD